MMSYLNCFMQVVGIDSLNLDKHVTTGCSHRAVKGSIVSCSILEASATRSAFTLGGIRMRR